jgi:2-polyprenyl-3-methyl-5-hydroxy-6-metoxy-1,4-benzoquinol methylase
MWGKIRHPPQVLTPMISIFKPWLRKSRNSPQSTEQVSDQNSRQISEGKTPYPISISPEPLYSAEVPAGGGVENFDTAGALEINRARLECLSSLQLPLEGKRVLDVGCGVGHLAQFFVRQGCDVLCLDARNENLARLNALYPNLKAQVFDIEKDSITDLGTFDVVFAFGLLYHLENPFRALRNLSTLCRELLLIETMVSDHHLPLVVMTEETSAYSQAVANIGCRPTPSFVALALRNAGISFVYAPRIQPNHPDYGFVWKNDLNDSRDGHLLRCVFIGSRRSLSNPNLVPLLEITDHDPQ